MKGIFKQPTDFTPLVDFSLNGSLLIEGRSVPKNAKTFYDPLIKFAKGIDFPTVDIELNMEYFNTATSKKILEVLQAIDQNPNVKILIINWHYNEDDEASLETGEVLAECLTKARMDFVSHHQAVTLSAI